MTASPAKIKAYLATIKGKLLDVGDNGSPNSITSTAADVGTTSTVTTICLQEMYLGLLKMELLLRGILVQDDIKVGKQVITSVGKTLLVDQQSSLSSSSSTIQPIPDPLLAGANIVAGRIAEAYYHRLVPVTNMQYEGQSVYGPSFSKDDADGAIQRAMDIQDERWLILLQNLIPPQSLIPNSHPDTDVTPIIVALDALQVALGYYTTAALIQKDTPPMWKKVWDVWTILKDSTTTISSSSLPTLIIAPPPYEAQVAIESLTRIALAKGNTKRGSELQLALIQSYLNNKSRTRLSNVASITKRQPSSKSSSSKSSMQDTTISIAECFGDSTITSRQLSIPSTPSIDLTMATKAKATLEDCRSYFDSVVVTAKSSIPTIVDPVSYSSTTPVVSAATLVEHPDVLLFQVLQVQVAIAVEDATVQQQADDDYGMDQNRSSIKGSPLEYLTKARESWILENIKQKTTTTTQWVRDSVLVPAEILRDSLLVLWHDTQTIMVDKERAESDSSSRDNFDAHKYVAFYWVNQVIARFQTQADIICRTTGDYFDNWNIVLKYIHPILIEINRQIHSRLLEELNEPDNEVLTPGGQKEIVVQRWLDQEMHPSADSLGFKKNMIASIVTIVPKIIWMIFGDQRLIESTILHTFDDELRLGMSILSSLIQQQQHILQLEKQSEKASSSVGSEKHNEGINNLMQWKQAHEAILCMICQDNDSEIYQVTTNAIARTKRKEAGGFVSFLQCLVAWSGWYQRPWPYCTNLSEVRGILNAAKTDLGRPLTGIEEILFDLASADAEMINGGRNETAFNLYCSALERIQDNKESISTALLHAHCLNGMARIPQMDEDLSNTSTDEDFARRNLEELYELEIPTKSHPLSLWHRTTIFNTAKVFELGVARQLVADQLILRGLCGDARSFLVAAVEDSPNDADAALALGAFLLRMALYNSVERNPADVKTAQMHLLKAARLDPSRANPFALIGVWFEDQGDEDRAKGCYTKSLLLDPCNPIAGRGLLRLVPRDDLRDILDTAINTNSPLNGWAWHSVGLNKSFTDGEDDMAAIAILKGLRCRDIASPESENLGIFYNAPQEKQTAGEKSIALADVGTCYRRLGRFTSSIRAFHASINSAGALVPSNVLISCAQVELELGLFDDAVQKFDAVLARKGPNSHPIASYGHASALLAIAQRNIGDGKGGSAYWNTLLAIESCLKSDTKFGCTWKLLGDLYTLGASFPPNVFSERVEETTDRDMDKFIAKQIAFVSEGEVAYRSCLKAQTHLFDSDIEDALELKCSVQCDIATNILLRAQILDPTGVTNDDSDASDLYERAATAFRTAIESNPLHAPSWCGFGCALLNKDALLAQHAFCRSIQLEKMFADAYANIGFLYTSKNKFAASMNTMESLTQVADTPMMWMNCAYLLEREAEISLSGHTAIGPEEHIVQSADAYRAALQVMKHPDAQLGLSLTNRVTNLKGTVQHDHSNRYWKSFKRIESSSLVQEYMGSSFRTKGVAEILHGVMSIEKSVEASPDAKWSLECYHEGKQLLNSALERLGKENGRLNVRSLLSVANPTDIDAEPAVTVDEPSSRSSIQQQIITHPDRPDLWISFTKVFIQNDALEEAMEAAVRASDMLTRKLCHPQQTNGESVYIVDAQQISEALSLEGWLRILNLTEQSGVGDKSDASYCLQRALLMNPENVLARSALVEGND
jgi:tetratricopeptide (TPR) repeat protein